ncbi:MAG: o-succinylbenzoate synthase [Mycobacteriales bacterium]
MIAEWVRSAEVHVVAIPMRLPFRGITVREAVLVSGPAGWGEFAPFIEYDIAEASTWLAAAHASAHERWPEPRRDAVPCNVTVPAASPETAARIVRDAAGTTVKVKVAEVGQDLGADETRVAAVREALDATGRRDAHIRVDANAGWSVPAAVAAIAVLDRAARGLEYAEQPCASVEELAALRRTVDVPIAADESIRRAEDPLRVVAAEAADVIVVKVAPLGGVRRAAEIVAACGLPAVVSSAVDTAVGLAAGVALAAALDELPYACGLGTGRLLESDIAEPPLLPDAGACLPVRRVAPDPDLLAVHAASPERRAWWLARVVACADYLDGASG